MMCSIYMKLLLINFLKVKIMDELIEALKVSISHLKKIEMGNNHFQMVLKLSDDDYRIIAEDIIEYFQKNDIKTINIQ